MRRRAYLRRVVACGAPLAVVGCLQHEEVRGTGGSTDSTTATTSPTATPRELDGTPKATTRTPADGIPRRVTLVGADDAALRSTYDVAANPTVVEPRVTNEHTATVRVTLTNRGDRDRTLTYAAEECDLNVMEGDQVDGDARLMLAPADLDWEPASDRCWRAHDRNVSCGIPATTHEVDLPADGVVEWDFDLWAPPDGTCMPPGRYRFERAFDEGAASLSVTLALSEPDT